MIELLKGVHVYQFNGSKVPGVTSVLKAAGVLRAFGSETDLARGTHVHAMIKFWFDGNLDVDNLPDWLNPYLIGVKNFVAETGFTPEEWETPIYDRFHRYAGTPDVKGKMRGQRLRCVVDFKTGTIGDWTKIQTAAYTKGEPMLRMAVGLGEGLRGGRNYDIEVYGVDTLVRHLQVFYASLTVANFISGG